jgi:hypothetical protein
LADVGPASNGERCDYSINALRHLGQWSIRHRRRLDQRPLQGPFREFRYDAQTATFAQPPVTISRPPASAPSRAARRRRRQRRRSCHLPLNENYDPELTFVTRHAVVWYRNATDTGWLAQSSTPTAAKPWLQ